MVQEHEIERLQNKCIDGDPQFTDPKNQKPTNALLPGYGNLGNTCFANSVLQCLVHTPALLEYCRLGRHSEGCTIKPYMIDIELDDIMKPM